MNESGSGVGAVRVLVRRVPDAEELRQVAQARLDPRLDRLGLGAYPRVRLLSRGATNLDALAIALSYTLIIVMANALGVVVALTLHLCGLAAVGFRML